MPRFHSGAATFYNISHICLLVSRSASSEKWNIQNDTDLKRWSSAASRIPLSLLLCIFLQMEDKKKRRYVAARAPMMLLAFSIVVLFFNNQTKVPQWTLYEECITVKTLPSVCPWGLLCGNCQRLWAAWVLVVLVQTESDLSVYPHWF